MTNTTFTLRVDRELKEQFTAAAKADDRTGAQLLRRFMRDFVEHQRDVAKYEASLRGQPALSNEAAPDVSTAVVARGSKRQRKHERKA